MVKALLVLSSLLSLTACQSVPVKTIEIQKPQTLTPKMNGDSDQDGVPDDLDRCSNTPIDKPIGNDGCPLDYEWGEPLKLEIYVFFDKNQTFLKPQYEEEIKHLTSLYHENNQPNNAPHIIIDSYSSVEENDSISKIRAMFIRQLLIEKYGINTKDIREIHTHRKSTTFQASQADEKEQSELKYKINQQVKIFVGF